MSPPTKAPSPQHSDGSALRIAIVHARWNSQIVEALVKGARDTLLKNGVHESNIVTQSCPGSWELPLAVQRLYSASQIQSSTAATPFDPSAGDLLGASPEEPRTTTGAATATATAKTAPFDAIIAIGVLIKGETMHFEYISAATCDGLMRVMLDTGVPVVLGVLTALNSEQAEARAGLHPIPSQHNHNHGEDWALAAIEMGVKRREWTRGEIDG